jgi:V/A-type H+-transporting ATPase subunit D
VSGAATRWRLIELQRRRQAILNGAELLDRKREGLLRALAERSRASVEARLALTTGIDEAYAILARALVEIGEAPALAATLAQPHLGRLEVQHDSVVGVRVPRLIASFDAAVPHYGPGGTCAALDDSLRAFAGLLPAIIRLAEDEEVERTLRRGLRRTTRTLNALRNVLLPVVETDIRAVASALEEEERDEAVRWRAGRS